MKALKISLGLMAIAMYSCSSLSTSPVYSDDVYFDAQKAKTQVDAKDSYSSSPTYNQPSNASTAPQGKAVSNSQASSVPENRSFAQAQQAYSQPEDGANVDPNVDPNSQDYPQQMGESDQSYAERIARFNGSFSNTPYYSDVYSSATDPNSGNVNVYVVDNGYNPWYNSYYGSPYIGSYWGNNWGWGFGAGFGFGWNSPYYGYGNSYYGYGYPYYGYGYPYYGYGGGYYSHHHGGGHNNNYTTESNQNYRYGPRPDGGSSYTNRGTADSNNGTNSYSRSPRRATSGSTYKSATTTEQYAAPARGTSYSGYSRSSQNAAVGATAPVGSSSRPVRETTYRRNYTPTYVQPSNNARPQYNSTGYSRPNTAPTRATQTQQSSYSRPAQPAVNSGSSVAPVRTSQPVQSYQRSPSNSSESSGNSGSRSYNNGGSSSGGGGNSTPSAPSNSGGGSRSPRR